MKGLSAGQFEKVASGIYLEGLAVDYRRNIVWYSDVIAGGVHGLMPDGKIESLNPGRRWTGGVMLNEDGCVFSSGQGGIMWNNLDSGLIRLAARQARGKDHQRRQRDDAGRQRGSVFRHRRYRDGRARRGDPADRALPAECRP